MGYNYISGPSNFVHMEGNSVDFRKTFDLNGTNNDEMLRLYLRKAGLSDEIECLSPEHRRAFIYDIIKSNKMPGHWIPSTMKTSAFAMPPPSVRPPPPPGSRIGIPSPFAERRSGNATISASSSSSSLQSMGSGCRSTGVGAAADGQGSSPIVMHRFMTASTTPAPPTSVLTSGKGTRYEISGPIHFEHVSGDMTRDMTRNAFELTPSMNDNVLKKYLIEHNITEDDISGMRKQDLICKIVQSQFTWKPPTRNSNPPTHVNMTQPKIVYATISTNNERSPPIAPQPTTPSSEPLVASNERVSNFTLITSRFADPSEFPSPDTLFNNVPQQSRSIPAPSPQPPIIKMPPLGRGPRPEPPPRKPKGSQEFVYEGPIPPPPSNVTAAPNESGIYHSEIDTPKSRSDNQSNWAPIPITTPGGTYAQLKKKKTHTVLQPPPPPPAMKTGGGIPGPPPPPPPPPPMMMNNGAPPPPPPPMMMNNGAPPPPPPPPPMMMNNGAPPTPQLGSQQRAPAAPRAAGASGDPRDAFLESIRKGVTLKKSDQKTATINSAKPRQEQQPPVKDFLSELKMGITLRRMKHVDDDDDEPDESQA